MKTKTITLIVATVLSSLLVGAFVINVLAPQELKLKVKWKPVNYTLNNPPSNPWNAEVYLAPARPIEEIDPSTILLEGMFAPALAPYPSPLRPRLMVPFDGYDVLTALLMKAGHLEPGEDFRVWLVITGQLYDGTPFSGSGGINLKVPEIPPP